MSGKFDPGKSIKGRLKVLFSFEGTTGGGERSGIIQDLVARFAPGGPGGGGSAYDYRGVTEVFFGVVKIEVNPTAAY